MGIMNYNRTLNGAKSWIIEESRFDSSSLGKCESIFCQGNGYLGQRAALEEAYVGETRNLFVTGTFNRSEENEVPELPNLPDLTNLTFYIDGKRFSMETGTVSQYSRSLNLRTGELVRTLFWESPQGNKFSLCFKRFASQTDEHLLGNRVEITPLDGDAEICVKSGINGQVTNSGSQHFPEGSMRLYDGRVLEMRSITRQSGVVCALHAVHSFTIGESPVTPALLPLIDRRAIYVQADLTCPRGSTFAVEKLTCVHTSRDACYANPPDAHAEDLSQKGRQLLQDASGLGYSQLMAESAKVWEKWWDENDITVESENDYHQLAVRFALYHINIMANKKDCRVGIAAKGLTGEGYKGHSFWDTEIFILPFFSLVQPNIARLLLEYRWYCLFGARQKARENGYSGAMYPWETTWITDSESTPLWGGADVTTGKPIKVKTGLIEHHITADISFAVWQYYSITGDDDFMQRYGYEILIDTARFWASRAIWDNAKNAYVIMDVIGPDEYKEHVNNNAYTNYLAHYNMRLALRVMAELPQKHPETAARLDALLQFEESAETIRVVADNLYLPKAQENGIISQFDGYFSLKQIDLAPYKQSKTVGTIYHDYSMEQIGEIQVAKQADLVMLFFLLHDLFDDETKRKNYKFYEERTLHDSSLSKNTHCVLTCDLGLWREAEEFFKGSCDIDLGPRMNTSNAGIHAAAMGGIWQCIVYGFGGVRVVQQELHITPHLHSEWKRLDFPLCWRGQALRIEITTESITVTNSGDKDVTVYISHQPVLVPKGSSHVQNI